MKSLASETLIIDTSDTFLWYFPTGLQYDDIGGKHYTEECICVTTSGDYSKEPLTWSASALKYLKDSKQVLFFVSGI